MISRDRWIVVVAAVFHNNDCVDGQIIMIRSIDFQKNLRFLCELCCSRKSAAAAANAISLSQTIPLVTFLRQAKRTVPCSLQDVIANYCGN